MKYGTICLPVLLLMGCSGSNTPKNDPLVGLNAPSLPKAGAGAVAKGAEGPLPALTAPSAETSAAALASGGVPKLDGDRNLRLDDKDPTATWRGQSAAGVSLGKPDLNGGSSTPQPIDDITRVSGPGTLTTNDLRQMIRSLEQRGMKGFRLDLQIATGQWRCTCAIPKRSNPNEKQGYDTMAKDPESAVRAVLDQVERDNR